MVSKFQSTKVNHILYVKSIKSISFDHIYIFIPMMSLNDSYPDNL